MTRKTEGVRLLVQDVLSSEFSEPYGEDIILDVCLAIEDNREWRRRYNELSEELRAWVVNNWIGKYVKEMTGLNSLRAVAIEEGHIIKAYTKLVPTKE
jgi:hypothetical protein